MLSYNGRSSYGIAQNSSWLHVVAMHVLPRSPLSSWSCGLVGPSFSGSWNGSRDGTSLTQRTLPSSRFQLWGLRPTCQIRLQLVFSQLCTSFLDLVVALLPCP